MALMLICPMFGGACHRPVVVHQETLFLAEPLNPPEDRDRRTTALRAALGETWTIERASDEDNAVFTCRVCELIQSSVAGIVDISGYEGQVMFELGIMMALGKPVVILVREGSESGAALPFEPEAVRVIRYKDYIDIVEPLKALLPELSVTGLPSSTLDELMKLRPELAEELRVITESTVAEFKDRLVGVKLEDISVAVVAPDIPADTIARLDELDEVIGILFQLGLIADAATACSRGVYCYYRDRIPEALAAFDLALVLEPDDPSLVAARATSYHALGNYEAAIIDFSRSLELRPDHAGTLHDRGMTYVQMQKYEEAAADYGRSLGLIPGQLTADVADDVTGQPDMDIAEAVSPVEAVNEPAVEVEPVETDTGEVPAELEAEAAETGPVAETEPEEPVAEPDHFEEALSDFHRSLELRPDDADTLYNLACLFALWGKPDDALNHLEKAITEDRKYRVTARTDEDFVTIRANPRFRKLVGVK